VSRSKNNGPITSASDIIDRAALTQRKETAKAMVRPSLAETLKMTRRTLSRADRTIKKVVKRVPPPSHIQCRAGCPWCCHIRVTASPPEILLPGLHQRTIRR